MKIAGDDPNEMNRMQQEAIRRVREMQARAQKSLQQSAPPYPEPVREREHPHEHEPQHERPVTKMPVPEHPSPGIGGLGGLGGLGALGDIGNNLFDTLLKDSEKTLILILILILVTEESDAMLVLALMYLIM